MANETIARRYASALADVVLKSGNADIVKNELSAWTEIFVGNDELQHVFGNPSVAHTAKKGVLERLLEKMKPSRATANFVRVLLQNGRLGDLVEINEKFGAILAERSGIVNAEVISARE